MEAVGFWWVEDDWLIVADLVQELEASGAHVIGPIPTLELALKKLDEMPDMSGAILDVNLRGQMVFPLADELGRRNIPPRPSGERSAP